MQRSKQVTNSSQSPFSTAEGDEFFDDPSAGGGDGPDDEDALELPVDPDEGMPVIPDDERVIDVPS
jgi:hypothetical protein